MKLFCSLLVFFKALIPDMLSAEPWPFAKINSTGESHSFHLFSLNDSDLKNTNSSTEIIYFRNGINYIVPVHKRWLGSRLMYTLGKRGCEEKYFEGLNPGEFLVFSSGTNDVFYKRHLYKQIINGGDLSEITFKMVVNYLKWIKTIEEKYRIIPIILSVIPPVFDPNIDRDSVCTPNDDRVIYSKFINSELKKQTKMSQYIYFDLNEFYSNKYGFLKDEYVSDGIHINPKDSEYFRQKLCDLIWDYEMSK